VNPHVSCRFVFAPSQPTPSVPQQISRTHGPIAHTPQRCTHETTLCLAPPPPSRPLPHLCLLHHRAWQDGFTGLFLALQNGHLEVVRLLLDSKADANLANKVQPLPPFHPTPRPVRCRLMIDVLSHRIIYCLILGPGLRFLPWNEYIYKIVKLKIMYQICIASRMPASVEISIKPLCVRDI
jgi:hypothetical protein